MSFGKRTDAGLRGPFRQWIASFAVQSLMEGIVRCHLKISGESLFVIAQKSDSFSNHNAYSLKTKTDELLNISGLRPNYKLQLIYFDENDRLIVRAYNANLA